jgi:hypothetical protein
MFDPVIGTRHGDIVAKARLGRGPGTFRGEGHVSLPEIAFGILREILADSGGSLAPHSGCAWPKES